MAEWAQRKKHEYHSVVLLRVESNIPQARNICVRNMKGDYIFFWNADTIAPKNAFKVALEALSQTGAPAAICTSYLLMDPRDMKAYGKDFRDDFVVLKKAAFDLVGYFNELFYVGEYELLRRLEEKDRAWVVNLPFTCIHLKPKKVASRKVKGLF